MRQVTLVNTTYNVSDKLTGFQINLANDKRIAFFGSNPSNGKMFFQFRCGATYIYEGITPAVRSGLWRSGSLLGYYAKNIKSKFSAVKLENSGVIRKDLVV